MTIYLTKFPTQAVAMLKHSETVNQLAKKGGDFIRYDENVRYLRQSKVMAWDIFHTEQYVQAMTNVNKIVPVKNTMLVASVLVVSTAIDAQHAGGLIR